MDASTFFVAQQVMAFVLGCCIGSFLNVVVYRLPAGKSLVSPGSQCPACGHPIAFYDNIPVLSFFILRGKCRHCKATFSGRYPLVEALCGLFTLMLFRRYGIHPQFFVELLFVYVLVTIAFIDLDTYLIPDVLSVSGVALGFAFSFFTPRLGWTDSLLGILLGGGMFYAVAVGYQYLRHQDGLGGGDIKLLGMIGAFLGIPGVLLTVVIASIVGAVVGVVVMRRQKTGLTAMVPFGPFLSLGALVYLFWGQSLIEWYVSSFLS
jgi:leader peptidase (prepilin peptidase) / N-methyltransferase